MTKVIFEAQPSAKARWVACAQREHKTLEQWLTDLANSAANNVDLPPPRWMLRAKFSRRLCDCLLREGLAKPADVRRAWAELGPDWFLSLPNFSHRCYNELAGWISDNRT